MEQLYAEKVGDTQQKSNYNVVMSSNLMMCF